MLPAKLGYAEVNYGAQLSKIVPKSMPSFWRDKNSQIAYVVQMKLFLDGKLNPKSIFYARDGVDKNDALMHLTSISNHFLLTNDDKLSVSAFLCSQWFKYLDILAN